LGEVELRGVVKRYPNAGGDAVAGVDLRVADGERFAIVGPSGSGKTTLLRIIAGLEDLTSGAVSLGGREMDGVPPRDRGVGMVFQNQSLYPHLDVAANLGFGLRARGVARAEAAGRVAEVAGWLGLGSLLRRRPRALSGGERQRVAIGRAVLGRPGVLLLDEPFAGLDAPLRASTRAALLDVHRREGWTMILVTHDQTEALAAGGRIALMRSGRVEQVGTAREVFDAPANRFVAGFLGDPPMAFLPCRLGPGRVRIGEGPEAVEATVPAGAARLPDRASATLGLRPEAIVVEPGSSDDGGRIVLDATLDRVEPRGHEAVAWLRVAGHPLAARVGAGFDRPIGASLPVGLDLGRACWFAADGEERRLD